MASSRLACPRCGYDLSGGLIGTSDRVRCSECGRDVTRREAAWGGFAPAQTVRLPGGVAVVLFLLLALGMIAVLAKLAGVI